MATFSYINNGDTGLVARTKINEGFESVISSGGVAGATGATGPAGATGATGPAGATGSAPVSDYAQYWSVKDINIDPVSVSLTTTWTKIGLATTGATVSSSFTHTTPNKLTYTGAGTKRFLVTHSTSWIQGTIGSAQLPLFVGVSKNGNNPVTSAATSDSSSYGLPLANGTGGYDVNGNMIIQLSTNDYIELYTKIFSGTSTHYLISINVSVIEI